MKIRGKVVEFTTRQTSSGTLTAFRLRSADGRDTQVETVRPVSLKLGDTVEVEGTLSSDLLLSADSVSAIGVPQPKLPWKWIAVGVAALILLAGAISMLSPRKENPPPVNPIPTSSVPVALIPPSSGQVMNVKTHLCLSPAGGSRDNNAPILQFNCDGDPARLWSAKVLSGDQVQLVNTNSSRCLTVAGGNTVMNDPSVQFNCDADPSRQWRFVAVGDKTFQLVNVNSRLCLAMPDAATGPNAVAVQKTCATDPAFEWTTP